MGAEKFKFVSPGIAYQEIDNSRLPGVQAGDAPVLIGRAERGPALRPVSVKSFSDFVEIFGNPFPGGGGGDVWRDGNKLSPSYAAYAAQAWLKNQDNLTFVRLLGSAHEDATTAGAAGWQIGSAHDATLSSGGAFGLFLIDSGTNTSNLTGTLAAVFYCSEGAITLSGSQRHTRAQITGTAVMISSQGTDREFKALVKNSAGTTTETIVFNFNRNSKKFIRSVFNTNPTLLNSSITNTAQLKTYFLGETFERAVADTVTGSASGGQFGFILALGSGSVDQNVQRNSMKGARSGWFISQHLGASGSYQADQMTKLFRFVAHDSGEWEQKNLKVSIEDVKASNDPESLYGSFTVVIRSTKDSDNAPRFVERFPGCNLNPHSPNFIAIKVGDKYVEWDDTTREFREFGDFDNKSKYVRVELNSDVRDGATNAELLPFGVLGPVRWKGFAAVSGGTVAQTFGSTATGNNFADAYVAGGSSIVFARTPGVFVDVGTTDFTGSFRFPAISLRTTSRVGNLANPQDAYFGADSTRSDSTRFENSYQDLVRALANQGEDIGASTEYSWTFSLDDLIPLGGVDAQWTSGSRASGISFTALTGTYTAILNQGFDRFTAPLWAGFDGVDITEKEPFNNRVLSGQTQTTSYEFNSLKRAIDSIADPEVVDSVLLSAPGITNTGITDHVLNVSEKRADTLGIIDLEGGFTPSSENASGDSAAANRGNVDTTVSNLKSRAVNTSYGTAYYPWCQIRDEEKGTIVWVPPSVIALGTYGNNDRKAETWMAPAGFSRAGLSKGDAGIPVVGVRERLNTKQRDKLYEVNINPIGKFSNQGIVVMGQKTLQLSPSATDRVNVRRMLITVKKAIARIAATLLFEQNLKTTWDRFTNQAEEFLNSVKTRFGLIDFRVVLDESTTTPDLVDRNTMYAKIYLKPAKAIEFIGLDFIITNSAAGFDD